jgi:glucuronate isomerase
MPSPPFIHENFLLSTNAARRLYREYAADEPIVDYHCHLSPADIAADRRFSNLWEIWIEGDHYKWRAMRSNGVPERLCTGDAPPHEKFMAWAATVPRTLRNPLYHWSHLELARYFGIGELLDERSAQRIWDKAGEMLAGNDLSAHGILRRFGVEVVGTTDDPADTLAHHRAIAGLGLAARVVPTYRPDKALGVHRPAEWNAWLETLEAASGVAISDVATFLHALGRRHDFFHEMGGRASDHGMESCCADFPTEAEAASIFGRARAGRPASPEEQARFASHVMLHVGRWDAEKGWAMQLHLGALRNNNTRLFRSLGPDTGFDSIGDSPQASALAGFLDRLDRENALPRTILYNLNPADTYVFASMLGNFQDGSLPGKIQLGSGWWFLDQKEGMEWQMNALSNLGLLSRFVGMVTDSRSFMSYPRHEYFRRVLCNLAGRDIEEGLLPDDMDLVGGMIAAICARNAREYFGFPAPGERA